MDDWEDEIRGPGGVLLGVWIPRNPNYVKKQEAPKMPEAPDTEKTWIMVQLVGENGMPIVNEKYKITLPDGKTVEGITDSNGALDYPAIDSGTCDIVFPDIDQGALKIV